MYIFFQVNVFDCNKVGSNGTLHDSEDEEETCTQTGKNYIYYI